ncbi:hypothetical protein GJ688_12495 [Heliobacillus mobilis]|uniref:Accessory gene regulator B n=1 Tax=Heliobacterium mobile TaxID=28064 RepID=A0A6I3SLG6_HELMO|nr:accessory gene regulator B family protein [Heliobacterium mobile]MTV49791.1 hypothetical protein [Heliobacterium mobile]
MDKYFQDISRYLSKSVNGTQETYETYLYALRFWCTSLITFFIISTVTLLLGVFELALISSVCSALVRITAGGAHHKKIETCVIMSSLVQILLAYIVGNYLSNIDPWVVWIVTLISTGFIIFLYAPTEAVTRPISQTDKVKFKKISFISFLFVIMLLAFAIVLEYNSIAVAGCIGLIWQCYTMTKIAFRINSLIDRIIDNVILLKNSTPCT